MTVEIRARLAPGVSVNMGTFADLTPLQPLSIGPSVTGEVVVSFPDDDALDDTMLAAIRARMESPPGPSGSVQQSLADVVAGGLPDLDAVREAVRLLATLVAPSAAPTTVEGAADDQQD